MKRIMRIALVCAVAPACQPQNLSRRRPAAIEPSQPAVPEPQAEEKRFQLSWNKTPQSVLRYEIRFGLTESSIAEKVLVVETAQGFDGEHPGAAVSLASERLSGQTQACFQIVAENAAGPSTPSDPVCVALP